MLMHRKIIIVYLCQHRWSFLPILIRICLFFYHTPLLSFPEAPRSHSHHLERKKPTSFLWENNSTARYDLAFFCLFYLIKKFNKPELWGIVGQDDELSLTVAQSLQSLSVTEHILSGLNNQLEAIVNALHGFFL